MDRRAFKPFPNNGRPPAPWYRRALAGTASGAITAAAIAALFWVHAAETQVAPPTADLKLVSLDSTPKPEGVPDPANLDPGAPPAVALPPPPQVTAPVVTIARARAADTSDLMSDSQLAGAASPGQGGAGGGRCNTAFAVQQVLRRDPRVRAALEGVDRLGKASLLWNGDWVQAGGQEGKGLAVLRQAIIWEVGFEPEACRNERMHGMVLLSLADGRTRFAIGTGDWRWSDLLGLSAAR